MTPVLGQPRVPHTPRPRPRKHSCGLDTQPTAVLQKVLGRRQPCALAAMQAKLSGRCPEVLG